MLIETDLTKDQAINEKKTMLDLDGSGIMENTKVAQ